jgi:hypothetical protein
MAGEGIAAALLFMALLPALPAAAQQIGQNAPAGGKETTTITVSTQLVVEAVVVKDKKGNPIRGLSAKDFTISENGAPQTISFCEHQELPEAASAPQAAQSQPKNIRIYDRLSRTRISPETPGKFRYQDRRLLALYFDMTTMPPRDQLRALDAAKKFIGTQMTPADLISILRSSGGGVDVLQDFTDDRDRLLSILETMIVGEGQGYGESSDDASTSDTGAAVGQDDSEFNVFNTDRQLSALQTAAKMLGQLSEKKSLSRRIRSMRWPGIRAAKLCSIATTLRKELRRRSRRPPATTFSGTIRPIRPKMANSAASRSC